jgi:hypothetical protein
VEADAQIRLLHDQRSVGSQVLRFEKFAHKGRNARSAVILQTARRAIRKNASPLAL